ncbi:MAG: hypothetical protein KUG82_15520 [Pseudomonadales bacterium]|nr:hypothetical protein [Pseudomonadales bacterium]
MISAQSLIHIIKQEASNLISSPKAVLALTVGGYLGGEALCLYFTTTLVVPTLFSALMAPSIFSSLMNFFAHRQTENFRA